MTQYDDHIWLTIDGEGWAIRAIDHNPLVIHLWRGYAPNLEFVSYEFNDPDWEGYCAAAVKMLEEHYGVGRAPQGR